MEKEVYEELLDELAKDMELSAQRKDWVQFSKLGAAYERLLQMQEHRKPTKKGG